MVAIVSGLGTGLFNNGAAPKIGNGLGQAGEGVFVNAVNGNLVLQRRDELLIGRGLDTELLRTYNSQARL